MWCTIRNGTEQESTQQSQSGDAKLTLPILRTAIPRARKGGTCRKQEDTFKGYESLRYSVLQQDQRPNIAGFPAEFKEAFWHNDMLFIGKHVIFSSHSMDDDFKNTDFPSDPILQGRYLTLPPYQGMYSKGLHIRSRYLDWVYEQFEEPRIQRQQMASEPKRSGTSAAGSQTKANNARATTPTQTHKEKTIEYERYMRMVNHVMARQALRNKPLGRLPSVTLDNARKIVQDIHTMDDISLEKKYRLPHHYGGLANAQEPFVPDVGKKPQAKSPDRNKVTFRRLSDCMETQHQWHTKPRELRVWQNNHGKLKKKHELTDIRISTKTVQGSPYKESPQRKTQGTVWTDDRSPTKLTGTKLSKDDDNSAEQEENNNTEHIIRSKTNSENETKDPSVSEKTTSSKETATDTDRAENSEKENEPDSQVSGSLLPLHQPMSKSDTLESKDLSMSENESKSKSDTIESKNLSLSEKVSKIKSDTIEDKDLSLSEKESKSKSDTNEKKNLSLSEKESKGKSDTNDDKDPSLSAKSTSDVQEERAMDENTADNSEQGQPMSQSVGSTNKSKSNTEIANKYQSLSGKSASVAMDGNTAEKIGQESESDSQAIQSLNQSKADSEMEEKRALDEIERKRQENSEHLRESESQEAGFLNQSNSKSEIENKDRSLSERSKLVSSGHEDQAMEESATEKSAQEVQSVSQAIGSMNRSKRNSEIEETRALDTDITENTPDEIKSYVQEETREDYEKESESNPLSQQEENETTEENAALPVYANSEDRENNDPIQDNRAMGMSSIENIKEITNRDVSETGGAESVEDELATRAKEDSKIESADQDNQESQNRTKVKMTGEEEVDVSQEDTGEADTTENVEH